MDKRLEKIFILFVDFLTINLSLAVFFYIRVETGWFEMFSEPSYWLASVGLYIYWLLLFIFVGMYRTWFALSRFDELSTLFKSTFVGIFILFVVILYDDSVHSTSDSNRLLIFLYWGILLLLVGSGRLFVRSFQRNLLIKGIGRRNALIIGFNPTAHKIHDSIVKFRSLGLDVQGYLAVKDENVGKEYKGAKVLDNVKNIEKWIDDYKVRNIIIALEKHEDDVMMNVITKCENKNVSIKIVPDLYNIIYGQVRVTQIYGFPLIDVMPQLMPEWEKKAKRLLDIVASFSILIITSPIMILTAIAIKLDSKGPVFFKQERSGLNGKEFLVYKFRSMVSDAEAKTGPVWSTKDDPRITRVGKLIRKVRIDELPQMINVLKGEMSLVGPRPERPYFVDMLSKEIPYYKRRLKVRPGVTGWAQVKHKYDESIEDVKMKLNYDLFYIENMSLRLDIKIIFRTVFVVLFGKGHFEN